MSQAEIYEFLQNHEGITYTIKQIQKKLKNKFSLQSVQSKLRRLRRSCGTGVHYRVGEFNIAYYWYDSRTKSDWEAEPPNLTKHAIELNVKKGGSKK